jgi:hypothetical protein
MLELQIEQTNNLDVSVFVKYIGSDKKQGGFNWSETEDGFDFWSKIIYGHNFSMFFKKYHDYEKYNIIPTASSNMEIILNVHNLIGTSDPNKISDNTFDQYCGQMISSEMFIADDSLEKDMKYGITKTHVFERIELLRILDEYISDNQREKFKTEILDNFWDGKSVVVICK